MTLITLSPDLQEIQYPHVAHAGSAVFVRNSSGPRMLEQVVKSLRVATAQFSVEAEIKHNRHETLRLMRKAAEQQASERALHKLGLLNEQREK